MWLLGGIIGLFIGAAVFGDSGWLIGAILGAITGISLKSSLKPDTPISTASSVGTEAAGPAVKQKWILWGGLVAGAVLLLLMAMKLLRPGENVKS